MIDCSPGTLRRRVRTTARVRHGIAPDHVAPALNLFKASAMVRWGVVRFRDPRPPLTRRSGIPGTRLRDRVMGHNVRVCRREVLAMTRESGKSGASNGLRGRGCKNARCADLRSYSGRVTERSVRTIGAGEMLVPFVCMRMRSGIGQCCAMVGVRYDALPRRVRRPARFDGFELRARVGDGFVVGHRGAASEQYGEAVVAEAFIQGSKCLRRGSR